jgi:hypothetical protein
MNQKTKTIVSWVFSGLALLFLLSGTIPKFIPSTAADFNNAFPNLAPAWVYGLVLIATIILYLMPKTTHVGFALATSYLGGAAALAWMTMGGASAVIVFIGITFLWIGHGLRYPEFCLLSKK